MSTVYCRSIRTNGSRCGSPALRGAAYCYYHASTLQRHRALRPAAQDSAVLHTLAPGRDDRPATMTIPSPVHLDLPMLEDRESVQIALSLLISAIAQNRIDPRLGRTLLYGLQVASTNAAGLKPPAFNSVSSVVTGEDGRQIAPDEDPEQLLALQRYLAQQPGEDEEEEDEYDGEDE